MQQTDSREPAPQDPVRASYAALIDAVSRDLPAIVRRVARDVAGPDEELADVEAEVLPAVERLVSVLGRGLEPAADVVADMREEGADAARAGVSVQRAIDRYLSAGWVIWAAASGIPERGRRGSRAALADLGAALLRTGDVAAAAIAGGHGSAIEEAAGRTATARAELLDELLEPSPAADSAARAARHALALGLDPGGAFDVIVATGFGGVEPDVEAASSVLFRPVRAPRRPSRQSGALIGQRGVRLVLVAAGDLGDDAASGAVRAALGDGWHAARSPALGGIGGVRDAYLEASSALVAVTRARAAGRVVPSAEVLVERTLLADEVVLESMVDRVLGPIAGARRGGAELVDTLAAWLDERMNAQATARRLRVAPRTVAYRLDRIERLTGHPLDGTEAARLSVALLGRRLLGRPSPGPEQGASDRPPPGAELGGSDRPSPG